MTQTLEERRIAVAELAAKGISTRLIAEQLGISQSAVVRDIRATDSRSGLATVVSRDGRERPAVAPRQPRVTEQTVPAAAYWPSNGHLIADVARLGYLRSEWLTLDPTYGRGAWWTQWRPTNVVCHDLRADGVDFRDLPHDDQTFDAVAYDPPYIANQGRGRQASTVDVFRDRYGLDHTPKTAAELQVYINDGLSEMHRVVKPRGIVLVKMMDYVADHRIWPGTHHTLTHALDLGFTLEDRFEFIRNRGPSRHERQLHARRNHSTLLVLRRR